MPEQFETWQLILLIPTAVAGLLGFFLGWLRWRFRHVEVAVDEWDDLVSARQEYLGDVRDQRRKLQILEAERSQFAERIQDAELKMSELHAQAQGATDRLRIATGERDAYRKEFDVVVADLERVNRHRNTLAEREEQVRQTAQQYEKARRRAAEMSDEIDRLRNQLRFAERQVPQEHHGSLDGRQSGHVDNTALRVELERSHSNLRAANSTIAALSGELTELRQQVSPGSDSRELRTQLGSAQHRLLEMESLLGDSSARIGQLETDLADAQYLAANKTAVISSLQAELAGAAASTESLRSQLGTAITDGSELAGVRNELALASERVRELATELAAERERGIMLQGQLAGSEVQIKQLLGRLGATDNVVDLRPDGVPTNEVPVGTSPDWPPSVS